MKLNTGLTAFTLISSFCAGAEAGDSVTTGTGRRKKVHLRGKAAISDANPADYTNPSNPNSDFSANKDASVGVEAESNPTIPDSSPTLLNLDLDGNDDDNCVCIYCDCGAFPLHHEHESPTLLSLDADKDDDDDIVSNPTIPYSSPALLNLDADNDDDDAFNCVCGCVPLASRTQ
jgi:hypothetical protein